MLAHHNGLGWLVDPSTLADEVRGARVCFVASKYCPHPFSPIFSDRSLGVKLAAEAKYNLNPYGFTVVTGCAFREGKHAGSPVPF